MSVPQFPYPAAVCLIFWTKVQRATFIQIIFHITWSIMCAFGDLLWIIILLPRAWGIHPCLQQFKSSQQALVKYFLHFRYCAKHWGCKKPTKQKKPLPPPKDLLVYGGDHMQMTAYNQAVHRKSWRESPRDALRNVISPGAGKAAALRPHVASGTALWVNPNFGIQILDKNVQQNRAKNRSLGHFTEDSGQHLFTNLWGSHSVSFKSS